METIKLTDYEMSDLYTVVYCAIDKRDLPDRLRGNKTFESMLRKINWHMSSKNSESPYDE